MRTLQGKGEEEDSAAVDLIAEEKVPKGILTPQIRKEAIGREVASRGEEEEDVEAEVVVEEEVVVDLVRAVVVAAAAVAVVVVVASEGSENSKEEVAAIARKSLFFAINVLFYTYVPGGLSLQKFKTCFTS